MPKPQWAMIPLFFATACVNGVSAPAVCSGTMAARTAHAAALADEGSDRVVVTGARLITLIDAGCGDAK